MQVDVTVTVPLVDAFSPSGADSGVHSVILTSYHPTRGQTPRVELHLPEGGTLIFDSDILIESVKHAAVRL